MKPLLRSPRHTRELDEQGACCLPFLLHDELLALRQLYQWAQPREQLSDVVRDVHMTIMSTDPGYKAAVRDGLMAVLAPACERLFEGHRVLAPFFIAKPSSEGSSIALHQDPAAVDEAQHWAVKLWIPLDDVAEEHGTFWYLPRSHRFHNPVRGLGVLWPDLREVAARARPWMRLCEMRAGMAVVFYHRLFHGSPPNRSARTRVAVSAGILPEEVPLRLYMQDGDRGALEVYDAPDDYVYTLDQGLRDAAARVPARSTRVASLPPEAGRVVRWEEVEPLLTGAAAANR